MYFVKSDAKTIISDTGESLEIALRALFFNKELGQNRIYRCEMPAGEDYEMFLFENETDAQQMCDDVNQAWQDNFYVSECK